MRGIMSDRPSILWRISCSALILLPVIAAFSRCFDYGLINLDDYAYIIGPEALKRFSGWTSVLWCLTDVSKAIWMPLTWLSYALDHCLFGAWYGGYHVHSVVIHAVNALLVWHLLTLLLPRDGRRVTSACCLVAALVWAIHPLRCESVVFLASRKDVLSFLWELLALIAWVRGSRCEATGRRCALTAASVALFLLGAMCKPSVMTFPLLCLLLDAFIVRRVRPLRYVVPVLLMLGLGAFAGWQQSAGGATESGAGEPLWARLSIAVSAFGIYIRNTLLPLWLAPQCIKRWPAMPRFLLPGAVISVLWAWILLRRLRSHWSARSETVSVTRIDDCPVCVDLDIRPDFVCAGMAWFALAVAPMLGLSSFGYHAYADRFTYIPSFGLSLMLAAGMKGLAHGHGVARAFLPGGIALVALAFATGWQTGFWRDDLTLFSRTLRVDGEGNYTAHIAIALHHFEQTHDLEKAVCHFERARDANETALNEAIGIHVMALAELGRDDEALEALRKYQNAVIGQFGEERAYRILRRMLGLSAREMKIASAHHLAQVAACLGKEPRLAEAREELDSALGRDPDGCAWQYLMWRYLVLSGRGDEAEAMLRRLLDPSTKTDYIQFRFLRMAVP